MGQAPSILHVNHREAFMKLFKLVTACALSLFVGQAALAAEKEVGG